MVQQETERGTQARVEDTYTNFLAGIESESATIFDDEEIRARIAVLRDSSAYPDARLQAYSDICGSTLRLIPFAIVKSTPHGIPPQELVGEAFGVIRGCIQNFDPDFVSPETGRPVKFSTYVVASLRAALLAPRTHMNPDVPFTADATVQAYLPLIRRAYNIFVQTNGSEPNTEELYYETLTLGLERTSITPIGLEQFSQIKARFIDKPYVKIGKAVTNGVVFSDSLELAAGKIEDTIPTEEEQADPVMCTEKRELTAKLSEALAGLAPIERDVIMLRFGLGSWNEHDYTQEEVARELEITRADVHRIEAEALEKLRDPSVAAKLQDFYSRTENRPKQLIFLRKNS